MSESHDTSIALELMKFQLETLSDKGLDIGKRAFTLTGEVGLDMFHRVEACMSFLEAQGDDAITIKLCSEGGSVYHAMAIIGRLKNSKCQIKMEAYGQIMSAATAIFASADHRAASEYTIFMFHLSSMSISESLKTRDIRIELTQVEKEDEIFNRHMAKFSERDEKFWEKLIKSGRNVYRTAAECKEYGLVDSII